MNDFRTYAMNIVALAISMSSINAFLQSVSLILAIIFTAISIYNKIKK